MAQTALRKRTRGDRGRWDLFPWCVADTGGRWSYRLLGTSPPGAAGGGAQVRVAGLPLHPSIHHATRCQGAGRGPGFCHLGGCGKGCQVCVLAGPKPDQGPVCRASAVKRGPGDGASLTHEPLLCSNWVRLSGSGPECLTLPAGHQRKSSLSPPD